MDLGAGCVGGIKARALPRLRLSALRTCKTLDEAIARITARPRICGLTLFVADTKARTAAAVGFSARHFQIVRLAPRCARKLSPNSCRLRKWNHHLSQFPMAPANDGVA